MTNLDRLDNRFGTRLLDPRFGAEFLPLHPVGTLVAVRPFRPVNPLRAFETGLGAIGPLAVVTLGTILRPFAPDWPLSALLPVIPAVATVFAAIRHAITTIRAIFRSSIRTSLDPGIFRARRIVARGIVARCVRTAAILAIIIAAFVAEPALLAGLHTVAIALLAILAVTLATTTITTVSITTISINGIAVTTVAIADVSILATVILEAIARRAILIIPIARHPVALARLLNRPLAASTFWRGHLGVGIFHKRLRCIWADVAWRPNIDRRVEIVIIFVVVNIRANDRDRLLKLRLGGGDNPVVMLGVLQIALGQNPIAT